MATQKATTYPDNVNLKLLVSHRHWAQGFVLDVPIGQAYEYRKSSPGVFEPVGPNAKAFTVYEAEVNSKR